jgi:hypothetical protein
MSTLKRTAKEGNGQPKRKKITSPTKPTPKSTVDQFEEEIIRKILMEKPDIGAKRTSFLRQIKKYRGEGRNIVYNDESFLHSSHTSPYGWYD